MSVELKDDDLMVEWVKQGAVFTVEGTDPKDTSWQYGYINFPDGTQKTWGAYKRQAEKFLKDKK
jgi:hypothetical protein